MFDPSVNASFRTIARKDAKDRSVRNHRPRYINEPRLQAMPFNNTTGARQSLLDSLARRR